MRELSIVELDVVSGGAGFFSWLGSLADAVVGGVEGILVGAGMGIVQGATTGSRVTGMGQPGFAGVLGVITGTCGAILGAPAGLIAGAVGGLGAGLQGGTAEVSNMVDSFNGWIAGLM